MHPASVLHFLISQRTEIPQRLTIRSSTVSESRCELDYPPSLWKEVLRQRAAGMSVQKNILTEPYLLRPLSLSELEWQLDLELIAINGLCACG